MFFPQLKQNNSKMNTIFQIIKVGQHIFKQLHKEKELIPQGFFQPFWEGALGPFALEIFDILTEIGKFFTII